MSLLETTLRSVRDQFAGLVGRGQIDLSVVQEPILDPQEMANGFWSLSDDHAEFLGGRRHHSLGTFIYRQPIAVPQLSEYLAGDRLRIAEPPFDLAGRLVLLTRERKTTAVEAGALRDLCLAWRYPEGRAEAPIHDLISLARNAGTAIAVLGDKSLPAVSPDTLRVAEPVFRWFCLLLDLAWANLPGSPFPETHRIPQVPYGLMPCPLRPRKPQAPITPDESTDESTEEAEQEAAVERLRQYRRKRLRPLLDLERKSRVTRPAVLRPRWYSTLLDVVRASGHALDILLFADSQEKDVQTKKGTRKKRSTEKGDARAKIIAALTLHHKYEAGSCLNQDPISVRELARKAEVAVSSVSEFLQKQFESHSKYKHVCRDVQKLIASLKLLNGEYPPHWIWSQSSLRTDRGTRDE